MTKTLFFLIISTLFFLTCKGQNNNDPISTQDEIIKKHLTNGAYKYSLYSREREEEIDQGLELDSTIALLWQQKAMPLFKQRKYELGMDCIDKAVEYERQNYQEYRAFIKCIFAKTYREAIIDFEDCKARYGNNYVMDHSYDFHIALSYLQLNQFKKAEEIFKKDIESLREDKGDDWVHHLDLFYYAISKFEQKKYEAAIKIFDLALERYPEFSDVQYYKAIALKSIGKVDEAKELIEKAKLNAQKGFTINEDNAIYEKYPYQVRWYF